MGNPDTITRIQGLLSVKFRDLQDHRLAGSITTYKYHDTPGFISNIFECNPAPFIPVGKRGGGEEVRRVTMDAILVDIVQVMD